jgi:tetratricopeptide (TPR) repeat protein
MLAVLGTSRNSEAKPFLPSSQDLKKEFVEVLGRRPPYPGFQAEEFLEGILQSLNMPIATKASILKQVLSGGMTPGDISSLLRTLHEEDRRWSEILGPAARQLKQLIADAGVDPFDADAVLALRQGSQIDSAIVGFVALDETLPLERRIAILEESTEQFHDDPALREIFGQALLDASNTTNESSRQNLLKRAAEQFSQAAELAGSYNSFFQWGLTLSGLSKLTTFDQKHSLRKESIQKYQQALQVKPDSHAALYNWGNALADLASFAEDEQKRSLLQEAIEKYQQALQIKPDKYEALNNWGSALTDLASLAEGEQKRSLLQGAVDKYQQALKVKLEAPRLDRTAAALLRLAGLEKGEELRRLAAEAAELARQANELSPGAADYNLACALSRLEQFDEAAALLRAKFERDSGLPSRALEDPDLQPLWAARPDFKAEIEERLATIRAESSPK